jgi:hypothetical protein
MRNKRLVSLVIVGLGCVVAPAAIETQQKPVIEIPQPGVPEIMTLEGNFVRAAWNNEGYVILGYQLANRSVGQEWMLLEVGMTVLDKTPAYKLTRGAMSIDTPDGKTIPLATISEQRAGDTRALEAREQVQRDSINYFPPSASQACRLGFFAEINSRALPWDEVELNRTRGCLGRLYFRVPGGIQYGQHWLNVKFGKSVVRVPFRILTKDEEKLLSKNYKSIKQQVEDSFKKKD